MSLRKKWQEDPLEVIKAAAGISQVVASAAVTAMSLLTMGYMTKKELEYLKRYENKSNPIVPMGSSIPKNKPTKWYRFFDLYWK